MKEMSERIEAMDQITQNMYREFKSSRVVRFAIVLRTLSGKRVGLSNIHLKRLVNWYLPDHSSKFFVSNFFSSYVRDIHFRNRGLKNDFTHPQPAYRCFLYRYMTRIYPRVMRCRVFRVELPRANSVQNGGSTRSASFKSRRLLLRMRTELEARQLPSESILD